MSFCESRSSRPFHRLGDRSILPHCRRPYLTACGRHRHGVYMAEVSASLFRQTGVAFDCFSAGNFDGTKISGFTKIRAISVDNDDDTVALPDRG